MKYDLNPIPTTKDWLLQCGRLGCDQSILIQVPQAAEYLWLPHDIYCSAACAEQEKDRMVSSSLKESL